MHILQYCLLIAHNCYELLKNFTILFIVFYASCHWRMSWNRQFFCNSGRGSLEIHYPLWVSTIRTFKKIKHEKEAWKHQLLPVKRSRVMVITTFLIFKSVVPVPPTHLLHNLESGDSWSLHQFASIHHHSKICFPKVIRMEQKMVTAKIPPCHDKYTGKQNILHSNFKVNTQ